MSQTKITREFYRIIKKIHQIYCEFIQDKTKINFVAIVAKKVYRREIIQNT